MFLGLIILFASQRDVSVSSSVQLSGIGASLPAEIYETWTAAFENDRRKFVSLDHKFSGVGSGLGKSVITSNSSSLQFTYAASDSLLTEQEYDANPQLQMVPVLAGALVLCYNLPLTPNLNLTAQHLVGIYNGTYTYWNDSDIQAYNTGLLLPHRPILVTARTDVSGSTEIFTSSLSEFSDEWAQTYGNFSAGVDQTTNLPVHWEKGVIRLFGRTSRGMSGLILSYIADIRVSGLQYANFIDTDGAPFKLETSRIKAAMTKSRSHLGQRLTANLRNYISGNDYPIVGFTYLIIRMQMVECAEAVEMARYIDWVAESSFARSQAEDFLMANIDSDFFPLIHETVVERMTCGTDKENVWRLVQMQKHEEWLSTQIWILPVMIAVPIVGLLMVALVVYIIVQQIRLRRALLSDDWRIDSDHIHLGWTRKDGVISCQKSNGSAVSLNFSTVSNLSLTVSPNVWGVGEWTSKSIALRELCHRGINLHSSSVRKTILWMRYKIHHANVLRIYGVTYVDSTAFLVSDHCPKGTLSDVIQNEKYRIDDNIKFSLALDIASGMMYLHGQGYVHGDLNSNSCYIDQRWNVKVSDWEQRQLKQVSERTGRLSKVGPVSSETDDSPHLQARRQFFVDPDLLRQQCQCPVKASDVYSFAMILVEVFTREDPYVEVTGLLEPYSVVEILRTSNPHMRPKIDDLKPTKVIHIIEKAWSPKVESRPSFQSLKKSLRDAKSSKKSVMDSMMEVLETYVNTLEEKVAERTADLAMANSSLRSLLHQMLPPCAAESLSRGEAVEPELFSSVSIYFSDIVGFTTLSAKSSPLEVVTLLNDLYTAFDAVVDAHDVYKVETIGDSYMVISGVPERNGIQHAGAVSRMALDLMATVAGFRIRHLPGESLMMRAGIHSGSVVAGVVGLKMPRYCLFGDSVNTASRMESTSQAMKIQISKDTHDLLGQIGGFVVTERGPIEIKGKGQMMTYFLESQQGH